MNRSRAQHIFQNKKNCAKFDLFLFFLGVFLVCLFSFFFGCVFLSVVDIKSKRKGAALVEITASLRWLWPDCVALWSVHSVRRGGFFFLLLFFSFSFLVQFVCDCEGVSFVQKKKKGIAKKKGKTSQNCVCSDHFFFFSSSGFFVLHFFLFLPFVIAV